jgi:hypothetical protein
MSGLFGSTPSLPPVPPPPDAPDVTTAESEKLRKEMADRLKKRKGAESTILTSGLTDQVTTQKKTLLGM